VSEAVRGPMGGGRVLVVSPDAAGPLDRGFRIRVHHLVSALASEHRVSLLAVGPRDERVAASLATKGVDLVVVDDPDPPRRWMHDLTLAATRRSVLWDRRRRARLRATAEGMLADGMFDAVQVERPELVGLARPGHVPVVLDCHNLWGELEARRADRATGGRPRRLRMVEVGRYTSAERQAWGRATACLATSPREAAIIGSCGARRVVVVPNGTDTSIALTERTPATPPELLFVGLLSYGPNADAVRWCVDAIMPAIWRRLPDATLVVVGGQASEELRRLAGPRVRFEGAVEDVGPHLSRAAAVMVPLRIGSGTRLKILDAFGAGRPVVATTIGAEGLAVRDGDQLLVRDEPEAFGSAVIRVVTEPELAARLGRSGSELVARTYAWERATAPMLQLYRELL
jgi:glycosyltransferase involved in cell wall biosynthesis